VTPPLTGVAVKLAGDPWHTGLVEVLMVSETVSAGTTARVMLLEVAGFPVAQRALEVRMQETTSPFEGM